MSDRLQDIQSDRGTPEECDDCTGEEPCDHHWLMREVHRMRSAVEFHQQAARDMQGRGERQVHGIDENLWAAVDAHGIV